MTDAALDKSLLAAIEDGLPIVSEPYAEIAKAIGSTEDGVLARLRRLLDAGTIKRFGLVVRHREVGYRANAMVVWDIEDGLVDQAAGEISRHACVTLCYRRPRRLPEWPYNLFSMIHGKDRETVEKQLAEIRRSTGLEDVPSAVLFSKRCFKQRGARFSNAGDGAAA